MFSENKEEKDSTTELAVDESKDVSTEPKLTPILLLLAPVGSLVDDGRIITISDGTLLDKLCEARLHTYSIVTVTVIELQLLVVDVQTLWPYCEVKLLENAPSGKYSTLFFLYGRQLETLLPEMLERELVKNQSLLDQEQSSYDSVFESLHKDALFQDSTQRFGSSLDDMDTE